MPAKADRQLNLIKWVSQQHEGQLIRSTNTPFADHLKYVAELAAPFDVLAYETGYCHDILEKTTITSLALYQKLQFFGYTLYESGHITTSVIELTDVFTKIKYPDLNKVKRKELEGSRICRSRSTAQTVKYADLYYNVNWMIQYDQSNALTYLQKKYELVTHMTSGNASLRNLLLELIANCFERYN